MENKIPVVDVFSYKYLDNCIIRLRYDDKFLYIERFIDTSLFGIRLFKKDILN
jgi:hypothetical protein